MQFAANDYYENIQHILPTNAHKTYKLLKYKIHENVILTSRQVLVYVITPPLGVPNAFLV
jgi:hypothetical protein